MYENYTEDELIETYTSMMDYSGKITDDLMHAIDSRGGLKEFRKKMKQKKVLEDETKRFSKEIFSLVTPETDLLYVRGAVKSDVLTRKEMDELVERKFAECKAFDRNRKVDKETIARSFLGAALACVGGALIWRFFALRVMVFPFFLIISNYFAAYWVIRTVTGKTRSNIAVFLATLLAAIGSVILGYYLVLHAIG